MKTSFVFPGQGSQYVGMGRFLRERFPEVSQFFETADRVLDFPLDKIISSGPEERLRETENTQPAIFTVSCAFLHILDKYGVKADITSGHSLGEYTALYYGGALSFEDGVRILRLRGRFMQEAVPLGQGTMAAIVGLQREKVEEILHLVEEEGGGVVDIAGLNSPNQVVVAGEVKAVEMAMDRAGAEGALLAKKLEVSAPFHSRLLKPAGVKLEAELEKIPINPLKVPYVANVDAEIVYDHTRVKEKLVQQVSRPVRWEDGIRKSLEFGVQRFIEVGPGRVLSGLIKKIDRTVDTISIDSPENLEKVIGG